MQNDSSATLISCNTLRPEIAYVFARDGIDMPVIYLESKLHNTPAKLLETLQDAVDSVTGAERILLGYGNCGNGVVGLHANDCEIIIPRVDDCISVLFGSQRTRMAYSSEHAAFFMTEGFWDMGYNLADEFAQLVEDYGEEDADEILEMMYHNYRTMAYLDTGVSDIADLQARTCGICEKLGLSQTVAPGTLTYLEMLLHGPWPDNRFLHVAPHATIVADEFYYFL